MRAVFLALLLTVLACTSDGAHVIVESQTPAVGPEGRLRENIGIETLGGAFTPLLQIGCTTPCSIVETFTTGQDNQSQIEVSLYRGNGKLVAHTHPLDPNGDDFLPHLPLAIAPCELDQLIKPARGLEEGVGQVEREGRAIAILTAPQVSEEPTDIGEEQVGEHKKWVLKPHLGLGSRVEPLGILQAGITFPHSPAG